MKKTVTLLSAILGLFSISQAQTDVPVEKKIDTVVSLKYKPLKHPRHLKVYENYEFDGGITKFGYKGAIGYSTNWEHHYYSKYTGWGEMGDYKGIKFNNFGFDWTMYKSIYNIKHVVFFNAFIGLAANYMTITSPGYESTNKFSRNFNYGVPLGWEVEVYLNNKFALLVHGEQKFLLNQSQGNWFYQLSGGIKYVLNHE